MHHNITHYDGDQLTAFGSINVIPNLAEIRQIILKSDGHIIVFP